MSTRKVCVGPVAIGGGAPVSVQTMTNTDTRDVTATLAQIRAMAGAGADIVRVSVYDEACAAAVRALVDGSPVPLVADIHFDHRLAIKSVENGISKVRINPGNIGGEDPRFAENSVALFPAEESGIFVVNGTWPSWYNDGINGEAVYAFAVSVGD